MSVLPNSDNLLKSEMADWIVVKDCPSCKSEKAVDRGKLPLAFYHFAGEKVCIPRKGISVFECKNCKLLYKDKMPSQLLLSQLISNKSDFVWSHQYNFIDETNLINSLFCGSSSYDLLDVGTANGNLLKASAKFGGRRSAVDIVPYPHLEIKDQGEFIQGFIDDSSLAWSHQKYDVITLFDVLEHLYNPIVAFSNLKKFLKKDGFVVIETGDSDQYWCQHEKISHWQYVRLFEHHVFWNFQAISYQAQKNGFEIVSYTHKQNKHLKDISLLKKIENLSMLGLYFSSKKAYYLLGKLMNKQGIQPINLFSKDHCQVVLRSIN
ncbi:MAG: class I SAM-dependent methyltransferase [Almyronema sp.]